MSFDEHIFKLTTPGRFGPLRRNGEALLVAQVQPVWLGVRKEGNTERGAHGASQASGFDDSADGHIEKVQGYRLAVRRRQEGRTAANPVECYSLKLGKIGDTLISCIYDVWVK